MSEQNPWSPAEPRPEPGPDPHAAPQAPSPAPQAPPPYGAQPPAYAAQPPPYGVQPPDYAAQPPPYGAPAQPQFPAYGTGAPYGYQAPGYGVAPPSSGTPGSTIALIVVSAISIVSCGLVLAGLPALIIGIIAATKAGQDPIGARRLTRTGWIVFGVVAAVTIVAVIVIVAIAVAADNGSSGGDSTIGTTAALRALVGT